VFHLLINSHSSSPFHCCRQFMFEALLSRLKREPKHFPSVSPDQEYRHLHISVQNRTCTNFFLLAHFPADAHIAFIFVFLANKIFGNVCVCVPIKVSALLRCHYSFCILSFLLYVWSIMYFYCFIHVFGWL
jgi:hypothetical protein